MNCRNAFSSYRYSNATKFMCKPSWLTSQLFLQFILNCKNYPILTVPVHHTRCRQDQTLATRLVDFLIIVSSLTWLYTADWPKDTQQQESNKMLSYWQFGTTLTFVTAHIRRELFRFLNDTPHSYRNINFSRSLIHFLFVISFMFHVVI